MIYEILLVRQGRQQGEAQPVVVSLVVDIGGQTVGGALALGHAVLGLVVAGRHVLDNLPVPLPPGPTLLLVEEEVRVILLFLAQKIIFLVRVQVSTDTNFQPRTEKVTVKGFSTFNLIRNNDIKVNSH